MSIKDFSLLAKLGEGAYSTVYRVKRLSDGETYALKKVKLNNLTDKEAENALNEVRILASIEHPNIVAYKEAFLEGKSLCIIMQFADDGDLSKKITDHKQRNAYFEESQVWRVLIQTVRGLKQLHEMKILHRDLKSANLFLNCNGKVQLGDMNVSKLAANGLLYTQTGTPYYASPQVWNESPYDSKSDIWSLGCVIYEMASLDVPFKAEDMEGLAGAITSGKYSPIPSHYSKQLSSVIGSMLQLKAKNRPSCDKLLKLAVVARRIQELQLQEVQTNNMELINTIYMPKKLQNLTDRLPKSKYQFIAGKHSVMQSHEPYEQKQRTNTLPKLDRILKEQEDIIKHKRLKSNSSEHSDSLIGRGMVHAPNRKERIQMDIQKIYEGKHQVNVVGRLHGRQRYEADKQNSYDSHERRRK